MNNRLFEVSLKAIIKNDKGEVLIMQDNGKFKGFYDFPGGRIQEGEENLELTSVLAREIVEETGDIKIKISKKPAAVGRHSIERTDGNKIFLIWIFFEAEFLGGEIIISDEHDGYKWVKLDEIELEKYFVLGSLDGIRNYLGKE